MSNTANLMLPLLAQSQAQKHVAVNESLAILDAVTQLTVESITRRDPPTAPVEGEAYALPPGPSGAWSFKKGKLAVFVNGGWAFIDPRAGWRAFVRDEARHYLHDGTGWLADAVTATPSGAATGLEVIEFEQAIGTGTAVNTATRIPAYTTVLGVTARVVTALGGSLSSWQLGVAESRGRYGSLLRKGSNSFAYGLTGMPITYYQDTPLRISAVGGTFNGGRIRIAIHLRHLAVARS
ncbi:DUF2793 domain-containing protein [Mangrovicoccus algicola]|uniref:DUF2793 domain-containing protein n=1 Tax=Mangrovicoccus algicola TaxID=2771008 RepID=A0A8J6Z147_9RHOB|nr:DUF2793 domain-containing protein [Mangrovicoccus algicola]MBE3639728.1 DUF2793 domain-containing protein [Mangrovicoccus algicola]